jgi:hypothetical protein
MIKDNTEFTPYSEYALSAIDTLFKAEGVDLRNRDRALLSLDAGSEEQSMERLSEIYEIMYLGFFDCAKKGAALHPNMKVSYTDIRSIYPSANKNFHNFARTYLSLSTLNGELVLSGIQHNAATQLLKKLEEAIGPVFFPSPKPNKKGLAKLEQSQRDLISKSGVAINVEELIQGNPIFRIKKSSDRILLWISLIVVIIVAIYEFTWIGRSDLAWVIIGLAIAIGLQALYFLKR